MMAAVTEQTSEVASSIIDFIALMYRIAAILNSKHQRLCWRSSQQ